MYCVGHQPRRQRSARLTLVLSGLLLMAGCQPQEEVRVYRVPKENSDQAPAHPHAGSWPRLTWKTPSGWVEQPGGSVRLVRFVVAGPEGQKADVAVLPLTATALEHGQIVNMVRDQIELGPLSADQLARQAQKVPIGGTEGELFDMTSTNLLIDGRFRARVLMAAVQREDTLWMFKMSGPEDLVASQRTNFLEFLSSVQFQAPPQPSADTPAAGPERPGQAASAVGSAATGSGRTPSSGQPQQGGSSPQWEVPQGWQEQPPGPLVLARYLVSDPDGKAEVTVSAFPGDTGGLLANLNRWRGQIGLEPVQAAEADNLVERLDVAAGQVSLVDMTGTDPRSGRATRLIGAVLARGSQTWFFKLRGDAPVVGRQRAAFLKFIQSARLPDA